MSNLYVLECEHGKYYIGKSKDIISRVDAHFDGNGSEWTKLHKPIRIIETIKDCDPFDEDKYTKKYMDKYGIINVRGGSYSTIILSSNTIDLLKRELQSSKDECFRCGQKGHFIRECSSPANLSSSVAIQSTTNCEEITTDTIVCYRCGRIGHTYDNCKATSCVGKITSLENCYRCGRPDHWLITCQVKRDIYGRVLNKGLSIGKVRLDWLGKLFT